MENYSTKSSFETFELQVTPVAQDFLRTAANWAMFLAILGFILLGLGLLGSLIFLAAGGAAGATGAFPFPVVGFGIVLLAFNVLGAFPVVHLFRFASKIKRAISEVNTQILTESFNGLKLFFVFVGIYVILAIIAYIVMIIYVVSMAATMGGGRF